MEPHIYNEQEAKVHFSKLLAAALRKEDVLIARNGKPVAKLIAHGNKMPKRRCSGLLRGKVKIAKDFDSILSNDILDAMDGN